jgi:hypothetical protein
MTPEPNPEFAAFIGIDWADAKHDICLQAAGSRHREFAVLPHRPDAIDEWAAALRQRFHGQAVAVCLEIARGPLVYALQKHDFFVLFPVNPATLAKYRQAFQPSHAQGRSGRCANRARDPSVPPRQAESLAATERRHSHARTSAGSATGIRR